MQRPGVCNALECLLVHRGAAARLLPAVGRALAEAGVELRCDPTSLAIPAPGRRAGGGRLPGRLRQGVPRPEVLAVRVVPELDGALDHIARYGSLHTEAILTRDLAARRAASSGR